VGLGKGKRKGIPPRFAAFSALGGSVVGGAGWTNRGPGHGVAGPHHGLFQVGLGDFRGAHAPSVKDGCANFGRARERRKLPLGGHPPNLLLGAETRGGTPGKGLRKIPQAATGGGSGDLRHPTKGREKKKKNGSALFHLTFEAVFSGDLLEISTKSFFSERWRPGKENVDGRSGGPSHVLPSLGGEGQNPFPKTFRRLADPRADPQMKKLRSRAGARHGEVREKCGKASVLPGLFKWGQSPFWIRKSSLMNQIFTVSRRGGRKTLQGILLRGKVGGRAIQRTEKRKDFRLVWARGEAFLLAV